MPRTYWTPAQIELLTKQYPNMPMPELESLLGRNKVNIYAKAASLAIKRSAEFMAEHGGRLKKGRRVSPATEFKKGQQPWNKGTHYVAGGRSAETRFKKGQVSPNTAPIGAYRITKDKTLQRKINNNPGSNSVRWRSVHELVWVAANGAVPQGHRIVFKLGRKTTVLEQITLDAVECLSFAEIMKRNTIHNYGPEISKASQLRAQITRQINRKTNKQKERQHGQHI